MSRNATLPESEVFPLDVENELLYNCLTITDYSTDGDPPMSKLEELVTPTELLSAVKDGAMKQELVKRYKASEQELAMMLLPMYRRGDLTKEEFNDFFNGVSLRKGEDGAEPAPPKTEDEPPSEILKSLSKIFGKKSHEAKQTPVEEAPPPSSVAETQELEVMTPEAAPEPPQEVAPAAVPEPAPEAAAEAEPEIVPEEAPEIVDERGADEELLAAGEPTPLTLAVEPQVAVTAEVYEDHSEEGFSGMDSAGFSSLLNSIFAKLNSIDKRLSAIEKKVLGK